MPDIVVEKLTFSIFTTVVNQFMNFSGKGFCKMALSNYSTSMHQYATRHSFCIFPICSVYFVQTQYQLLNDVVNAGMNDC